jgi:microsomal dipeptidase-like Zn-dependent dipeptidase
MDVAQMQQAAKEGAFIEFVAGSIAGPGGPAKVDSYADAMRKVGIESCILSSDLGQRGNALPPDGLAAFLLALRARGFTDAELDRISKGNPAQVLDLKGP